jgi:16S rRNA (cytosine1402-N4)-methyltransferase
MRAFEGAGTHAQHAPVMVAAVVEHLGPPLVAAGDGALLVDGTVGYGGHAEALLAAAPGAVLLGIDRDGDALEAAAARLRPLGRRVHLVHGNAADWREHVEAAGLGPARAMLLDLGVSSPQLDRPERGFSFRHDGPLDMRMDRSRGPTAADLLARVGETELERILRQYGEERHARRIARHLVDVRRRVPLVTTRALAEAVIAALPPAARRPGPDHPARRTFQALRIAVNDELGSLERALRGAAPVLAPGGRLAVVSFHSLEDRIVKRALRAGHDAGVFTLLTRRPLVAGAAERRENPRARSAKLRVAERSDGRVGGAGNDAWDD